MKKFRCLVLAGLAAASGPLLSAQNVAASDISRERELIIRDTRVVDSVEARLDHLGGRLSLPFLLGNLGLDPDPRRSARAAVLSLLHAWQDASGANGWSPEKTLIGQWKVRDGLAADLPDAAWEPNFEHAAFRLLAITHRLDLMQKDAGTGLPLNAGEIRFVYCLTAGSGTTAPSRQATMILEYGVPAGTWAEVQNWAWAWHQLGALDPAQPGYVAALIALTTKVTQRGAAPHLPRNSALLRIRINDQAMSGDLAWHLREFQIDGQGKFFAAPTPETPRDNLQHAPALTDYINANAAQIKAGSHRVRPDLLGSGARLEDVGAVLWDPPSGTTNAVPDPEARFRLALNTCSGCHGVEARPKSSPVLAPSFTHIEPRNAGALSRLSPLLEDVAPVDDKTGKVYPKLKEITHRQEVMAELVNQAIAASLLSNTESHGPSPKLLQLLAARANRAD